MIRSRINVCKSIYVYNIYLHVTIPQVQELRQDLIKLYLTSSSGTSKRRSYRRSGQRQGSEERYHSDVEVRCLHHT